jgi:hypothetical protein
MKYKVLDSCLEIIQTGFTLRTREEMKQFDRLIGVPLVVNLLDVEKYKKKEMKDEEFIGIWNERAKSFATWLVETCRFSRELAESERKADVQIEVDTGGYVRMTPRNFLGAVVARYFEFNYAARLLDLAVSTAHKYLEPFCKKEDEK